MTDIKVVLQNPFAINPNRWAARTRSTQARRMKWEPPKRPIVPRISVSPSVEASHGFGDAAMKLPKPRNTSTDVSGQSTPIRNAFRGALRAIARPARSRHASSDSGSPANASDDERMTKEGAQGRLLSRDDRRAELEAIPARAPIELPVEEVPHELPASAPSPVEHYAVPDPEDWRRG